MKKIALVSIITIISVGLTGCGRGSKTTTNVHTATTGQQLTDLQTALDNGLITQKEYDTKRKNILKNG